jgi:hypothetical protein
VTDGRDEKPSADEQNADAATPVPAEGGFRRLIEKLHVEHGVDVRDYKEPSLGRRSSGG